MPEKVNFTPINVVNLFAVNELDKQSRALTLIWVSFRGVCFEVERGRVKYTFWYQGPLNFADVSIFYKKKYFFGININFTQRNSVRAVLETLQLCFQFL